MTQKQLEKEARKLYRRVYDKTVVCGHEYAQREAEKAYGVYITRFQSHVTNLPRVEGIAEAMEKAVNDFFEKQGKLSCEPVSNADELQRFTGPDWSEAPNGATHCAQDEDGFIIYFVGEPVKSSNGWTARAGGAYIAPVNRRFAPPADWKSAIWERPVGVAELVYVTHIDEDSIAFNDGTVLSSDHEQDCCESHYLSFSDLDKSDFYGLVFDISGDSFFERVEGYGIALLPKNGHPVRVPGYGSNNGYYSSNLTLVLLKNGDIFKSFDITECQTISE